MLVLGKKVCVTTKKNQQDKTNTYFMMHVILPFRKQCQTVEGQEWHHPKSSSSESDDMQKMPDSDSLFAY